MLKIKLEDKYPGHCIYLVSEETVQNEFLRIVENISKREEPFWDPLSLAAMEVVDGARREGDYTIVTERGRGCMHSLSYECQAALILIYGQNRYRVPRRVRLAMFSTETLAWLNSLEIDIEILLPAEVDGDWILDEQIKVLENLAEQQQFYVEDQLTGKDIRNWKNDLHVMAGEIDYLYRGMDPEKVGKHYKHYMRGREEERVISEMKQEMAMSDFLKLFGIEESGDDHFRIINTCRTLRKMDYDGERMMILLDEHGIHQHVISGKNPGYALVNEIMTKCSEPKGRTVALMLNCEPERFRTSFYTTHTEVGFLIDFEQSVIKICHEHLAVREFYRAYAAVFGEWVEEDD